MNNRKLPSPLEKIRLRLAADGETLKRLSFGKKVEFIIGYYKIPFLIFLILCLFVWYVGDAISSSRNDILLNVFITNDDYDIFNAGRLKADFTQLHPLEKRQAYEFDDTMYIALNGDATELTAASRGKIIAYMTTRELDAVITTESVYDNYFCSVDIPVEPLENILGEELLAALQPYLVEGLDFEGDSAYTALDLSGCRYVKNANLPAGMELNEGYYMFVPYGAPHPGAIRRLVEMLYS